MADETCPKCGTAYQPNQVVCLKCGNLLFNPSNSTVHVRVDPSLLRLRRTRPRDASSTGMDRTIRLQIRGMTERLTFEEGTEIVLGRVDLSAPTTSRLDLTRYGAHERGVSREHAVLRFNAGKLTITDLGSVNGTSVNMKRLKPNQPHVLQDNDDVLVGKLSIVIKFESLARSQEQPDDDETLQLLTRPANLSQLADESTHEKTQPSKPIDAAQSAGLMGTAPLTPDNQPEKRGTKELHERDGRQPPTGTNDREG